MLETTIAWTCERVEDATTGLFVWTLEAVKLTEISSMSSATGTTHRGENPNKYYDLASTQALTIAVTSALVIFDIVPSSFDF